MRSWACTGTPTADAVSAHSVAVAAKILLVMPLQYIPAKRPQHDFGQAVFDQRIERPPSAFYQIGGLLRAGVEVVHSGVADVHATGHAQADELKTYLSITSPQWYVPIHGEYRHLVANEIGRAHV